MPVNIHRTWLANIPKIELHLHLEGAIPLTTLWELIQKYGGDPNVRNIADLEHRFSYSDFSHFIQTWVWKNKFLREYQDFEFVAEAVAQDLKSQNIVYAEAFISPPDFAKHGLHVVGIIESVRKGLNKIAGIQVNLVVDLVRDYGVNQGESTLCAVLEARDLGILGIGIGGSEREFPPALYKNIYEKARSHGLRTSAHAGEAAGPESIWGAIYDLKVDRIGHATRAIEDRKLTEFLIESHLPLEMCPISNLRTRVVSSIKDHPIRELFDAGALVTVNTDDPKMFNNTLVDEFDYLMQYHSFTPNEIKELTLNAARASWLQDDRKTKLLEEITISSMWREAVT